MAWSVTGQSALRELLLDPRVSKDPRRHWPEWIEGRISPDWPLYTWVAVRNMFTAYGAEHKRLRTLISKAFTARSAERLRPRVEEISAGLIDSLAAREPGTAVDIREEFAYPLPIRVIGELFGVPAALRGDLRRAVDGVFQTAATPEQVAATYRDLYAVLGELVAAKRAEPADDMTSGLIAAREEAPVDGAATARLNEAELVDTLVLMIGAGYETTVNLLDNAVHALLTHPEQLALVREGRASWDDVIEETLRWSAPLASMPLRFAVEDIDVEGVTIRKGEAIMPAYAAAGRDPETHGKDADRFDVTRVGKEHLAFGHGVHFCLGASLARLEARTALPALFDRFPDMALAVPADELEPLESFIANGHRNLPVFLRRG